MALRDIEPLVIEAFVNFLKSNQDEPNSKQELLQFLTDIMANTQEEEGKEDKEDIDPAFLSKKAYKAFSKARIKESNFKNFYVLFELAYQFANKQLSPDRLEAIYKQFSDDEKTKQSLNTSLSKLYNWTVNKNMKIALDLVEQRGSQSAKECVEKIQDANGDAQVISNALRDYVKSHFFGAFANARLKKINNIISVLESLQKYGEELPSPVEQSLVSEGKEETKEGLSERGSASNKEEEALIPDNSAQPKSETVSQNEKKFKKWRKELIAKNYSYIEAIKILEFGTLETSKALYTHGKAEQFEDPVSKQLIDKAAMLLIDNTGSASKDKPVRQGAFVEESYALKCMEEQLNDPVCGAALVDYYLIAQTDQSGDEMQQKVNAFQRELDAFMQSAEKNYHKALAALNQETSEVSQQDVQQDTDNESVDLPEPMFPALDALMKGNPITEQVVRPSSTGFFSQREKEGSLDNNTDLQARQDKSDSEEKPEPEKLKEEQEIVFPEIPQDEPASNREEPEQEPDRPQRGKLPG